MPAYMDSSPHSSVSSSAISLTLWASSVFICFLSLSDTRFASDLSFSIPPAFSSSLSTSSAAGYMLTRSVFSMDFWLSQSKYLMVSISSPHSSIRIGFSSVSGKTSRIPPLTENCPIVWT